MFQRRYKSIDILVYMATIVGPLTAIPQIMKTWALQSAHELSLTMWLSGSVFSVIWLLHGLQKKDNPIIVTNAIWLVFNSIMIVQIFMYS